MSSVSIDVCPTCGARETEIPGSKGVKEFKTGSYKYLGDTYPCDCHAQMALRIRYLLANIGDQYWRLDWEQDYFGPDDIKDQVQLYLDQWPDFKMHGMGMEFGGPLGTGKTFAATYIGKELIKQGQRVYFIPFVNVVSAFSKDDGDEIEDRMSNSTFVILDELQPAMMSERQHDLYAMRFEALIRHRTNFNLPTIITTNMTSDELDEEYPRIYSLLAAKQLRIDMSGIDARRNRIAQTNYEFVKNGEKRPIT